jgi:3-oxoadipate enol-lactonase
LPKVKIMRYLFTLFLQIAFLISWGQRDSSEKGYIAEGKLNIFYQSKGSGPAIIFLHGGYLDMHMWENQVAFFSATHRVITIDLPGHGRTNGIDSLNIARIIRDFMDILHIDKASFVGLSLGSVCLTEFALAYPERIEKIILCSPGLTGWRGFVNLDSLSGNLFEHADSLYKIRNYSMMAEYFTRLWCDGPFRGPSAVDPATRNYVLQTVRINNLHADDYWPIFNHDGQAKNIKRIAIPVLILTGDLDLPFISSIATFINQKVTGSKRLIVHGAAHMINLEKPELVNQYISAFLEK